MTQWKTCAYQLDGKILCDECYFEALEKGNINDAPEQTVTDREFRKMFGKEEQTWCKNCGIAIVYDRGSSGGAL